MKEIPKFINADQDFISRKLSHLLEYKIPKESESIETIKDSLKIWEQEIENLVKAHISPCDDLISIFNDLSSDPQFDYMRIFYNRSKEEYIEYIEKKSELKKKNIKKILDYISISDPLLIGYVPKFASLEEKTDFILTKLNYYLMIIFIV